MIPVITHSYFDGLHRFFTYHKTMILRFRAENLFEEPLE